MDLIQVDDIHPKSPKAIFRFLADRRSFQNRTQLPALIQTSHAFGEGISSRTAPTLQRTPHDFLGVSQTVDRSRIDPVRTKLQRSMNRRDRIIVVLRAPAKLPARAPDRPCSISNRSNLQI